MRLFLTLFDTRRFIFAFMSSFLDYCKGLFTPLNHQAVAQLQAVRMLQQGFLPDSRERTTLTTAAIITYISHYFIITSKACQETGLRYIPDFLISNTVYKEFWYFTWATALSGQSIIWHFGNQLLSNWANGFHSGSDLECYLTQLKRCWRWLYQASYCNPCTQSSAFSIHREKQCNPSRWFQYTK